MGQDERAIVASMDLWLPDEFWRPQKDSPAWNPYAEASSHKALNVLEATVSALRLLRSERHHKRFEEQIRRDRIKQGIFWPTLNQRFFDEHPEDGWWNTEDFWHNMVKPFVMCSTAAEAVEMSRQIAREEREAVQRGLKYLETL